jgi:predicted MFS family arabinose efflux permease
MYLGTMSGPVLTGLCYDRYKTYSTAWLAMAFLSLLGIPLALTLRPPQNHVGIGVQALKTTKEAD